MPGAPFEISVNGWPVQRFSTASRSGTWSVATRSRRPSSSASHSSCLVSDGAERWRDDRRDRGFIGQLVARLVERQVVRAGLGQDPLAGRAGRRDRGHGRRRRDMDEIDGGIDLSGDRDRAGRASRLTGGRPRVGMVPWARPAGVDLTGDARVEQGAVLAVHLEEAAHRIDGGQERAQPHLVHPEVVDEEAFERRDALIDGRRDVGLGPLLLGRDDRGQPDVDGALARGRGAPLGDSGAEGPLRVGADAGARVVEREERRRPAERGGDRIGEEAVGLVVAGDPDVGVDVDDTRQDEQVRRVDDLDGGIGRDDRRDVDDPVAADGDIRLPGAGRGDDRPAPDEPVERHGRATSGTSAELDRSIVSRPLGSRSAERPATGRVARPLAAAPAPGSATGSGCPTAGRPCSRSRRCRRRGGSRTR